MAIRVVVAGLGPRGRDWVRQLRTRPAFEIVACAELDPEVLARAASELAIPAEQRFADIVGALSHSHCDAAVVATPAETHRDVCEAVLSRGVAVMVEKPFATRLCDASDLVALADAKQVPLLVAQNYRYLRWARTARRLIQEGILGPVGMVVCHYYRVPHDMAASLARQSQTILWGIGVHHFDLLRHVLGQEPIGVNADSFTLPWGPPLSGASMRALVSFDGGTRALYSATYQSSGHEFFERGQEFVTVQAVQADMTSVPYGA